jgi:hypothetical protein
MATATKAPETVVSDIQPSTDLVELEASNYSTDPHQEIQRFTGGNTGIMSTFTGDDFFQTAKTQLAATSGSVPLGDHLKETILLDNWVLTPIEIADDNGELHKSVRVTLVDSTNGKSYHGTGMPLVNALKGIVSALGGKLPAEWPEPLPIKVIEGKSRKGFKFFDVQVVL